MTMIRSLLFAALVLPAVAGAQYVATPQAGVPYPALTAPTPVALTAPGTNDPKDKGRATLPLGFTMPFYNRVYTQVTVTANGVLFLEPSTGPNTASDFPGNVVLPNGSEPNAVIAPFWDDLTGSNPTSALQSQAVTGPNGQGLAIEFKDWNRAFGAFTLNVQVRLWANGIIEFFYGTMTGSGATAITATIGIESPSGTAATSALSCSPSCNLTSFDPGGTGTPINYLRFGPPTGVDLQALVLRVDGITQAGSDLSIGTTFTLRNFGTAASGPFDYQLFLSQDTLVDGADLPLTPAPATLGSLGSLQVTSTSHTGSVTRPDGGSWYVLASIPQLPDGGDLNVFNNVVASSVPYAAGVDLIAEAVTPPPVAGPGDPVQVQVQFSNQGFEPAGSVAVKLYASVDTLLSADDRLLAQQAVPVLGGQQVQQPITFTLASSVAAGDFFVIMQLDDAPDAGAIVERSELNNVVSSPAVMQIRQADLTVTDVRVMRATPPLEEVSVAFFGEPARFEAFVANVGGATANNVSVNFFLSDNESLNAVTDKLVGSVTGQTFAPGEARWVTLASAPMPTTDVQGRTLLVQPYFFFGSATSPGLVELNGNNNFAKSSPVVLRNPAPNLVPVELQAPSRAGAGELIVVSRTLSNLGNRPASTAKYRYYLSANTIITPDDLPVLRVTSGGEVADGTVTLAVGQRDSAVEILRLPQSLASSQYFLGVLLDPDDELEEADETDNGLAASRTDVVAQSLSIATPALPDALVGVPYRAQLEGQGGTGTYAFALADAASLPRGLTLSPSGLISGTPSLAGASTVLIEVSSGGRAVIVARPLRVAPVTASLAIDTTALPAPTRFVPYRANLAAAGGAAPYSFQLITGFLPTGLTLTSDGTLSGTPSDALGTMRNFVVRVTDAIGNVDERAFTMTVVDAAPFTIRTQLLKDGLVGAEYLDSVVVWNPSGAPVSTPVRWSVISGELPPGLALEPSTSDTLLISGTPTRPGRYRFTLEAIDAQGRTDGYTYLVDVGAPDVRASAEGTALALPGDSVTVTFKASSLPEGARWFWRDGRLPPGLVFAEDGTVTGTIPSDAPTGLYTFSVGVGLSRAQFLSVASWTIEVAAERPRRASCASVDGGLLGLAGLLLVARRRRK
ncbi:MAG: putative Ig domain-containing protein [Myxococcota bacterium]